MSTVPGFSCPECSKRIVVTMDQLLAEDPVVCSGCGLTLVIDRKRSAESLAAVHELQQKLAAVAQKSPK
jgi:transcription elongation factor Elf1